MFGRFEAFVTCHTFAECIVGDQSVETALLIELLRPVDCHYGGFDGVFSDICSAMEYDR
jgi:hypothetical protein